MTLPLFETGLQATVIDIAHLYGWKVAYFRPARTEKGYRTPVGADGKGWPDLILVRLERLIAAELKVGSRRATLEQLEWLERLRMAGAETYIWRETDLEAIKQILMDGPYRSAKRYLVDA